MSRREGWRSIAYADGEVGDFGYYKYACGNKEIVANLRWKSCLFLPHWLTAMKTRDPAPSASSFAA